MISVHKKSVIRETRSATTIFAYIVSELLCNHFFLEKLGNYSNGESNQRGNTVCCSYRSFLETVSSLDTKSSNLFIF